jgi:acylphosphatase
MVTRQIRVSGRVQGVGYRDALRAQAERSGVCGWVRNRRDGTVEAVLQGSAQAVDEVMRWAQRGPAGAQVAAVAADAPAAEFERPYDRFERWPSV